MNIAYLTTVYPSVSHTFIRREILQLEKAGHTIHRFSVRAPKKCVDALDQVERDKTFYCLEQSLVKMFIQTLLFFMTHPIKWLKAFKETCKFSSQSERGLIRHLAYLVEAISLGVELQSRNVSHVHVHFGTNATAVAYLVKQLVGVSYSFTAHGPDEFDAPIGLSLNKKIIESSFVVAISNYGAAQLKRWVPLHQWKKIYVVGCSIEIGRAHV